MKKSKYHIICSRLLLFLFITGQVIVYSHHHNISESVGKARQQSAHQVITEKCQLCVAMHNNSMVLSQHVYFKPIALISPVFIAGIYKFAGTPLVLSAGRSPPLS